VQLQATTGAHRVAHPLGEARGLAMFPLLRLREQHEHLPRLLSTGAPKPLHQSDGRVDGIEEDDQVDLAYVETFLSD
jgi:hypothetical protein